MPRHSSYDFIFTGSGCAALSLLMRMLRHDAFKDKRILLLDKAPKTANDRTWCFWENGPGFFEEIVYRKWDHVSFLSDTYSSVMDIAPYQYKMIRGADFYDFCRIEIARHLDLETIYTDIISWSRDAGQIIFKCSSGDIVLADTGTTIFNSIATLPEFTPGATRLLQHFKGYVVETAQPAFTVTEAIMMDFRVEQDHGTSFAYLLPFSETKALVEYTLFTRELLAPAQYDEELKNYMQGILRTGDYKITEEEFGIIPMTNEAFVHPGPGVHIGTAGGQTKASSGYSFQFIQKHSQQLVEALLSGKPPGKTGRTPARFRFYDHTLLHILYHDKVPGKQIFSRLFQKNKPRQVLRFLDNETSLREELQIIRSLPAWPFFRAALKQL